MKKPARWEKIASKLIYTNSYGVRLFEDKIVKHGGQKGIYGYLSIPRTVGIFAINTDKEIYLARQYRYLFNDYSLEIARGFVKKNESLLSAAQRELREELGLRGKNWSLLGRLRTSVGLVNEEAYLYICQNLKKYQPILEKGEAFEIITIKFKKLLEMIYKGEILDSLTIVSSFLAKEKLML